MAGRVLQKLKEGLNCSICLHTYTDPKLLRCFHAYCQECMVKLVDQDQLTCRICHQVTPIPDRGVAGLPPAFHINHLLEIQDSVKKLDNPAEGAVGGATIAAPCRDTVKHCFEHLVEEVKLCCETCGELVCYKCVIRGGKHQKHNYKEIGKALQEYKEWIMSSLEPMEEQVKTIKKAVALFDARCGEISDQRAATKNKVHDSFKRLREALDARETELIDLLDGLTQSKLKGLAAQKDLIETTLTQLNSCLSFMRDSLKTGNKFDMLMMKMSTEDQVKELTTPFPPDALEPNTGANIVFTGLEEMAVCRNFGYLSSDILDPSKCFATGLELAVVGETSTAILHTINSDDKPCKQQIKSLECRLLSDVAGTEASCGVERRGHSQYEISYQPTIKGRHQLHIKVEGQPIGGGPFLVAVTSPGEKLDLPIQTIYGELAPWGVAVTPKGEVVVSNYDVQCVSVFSGQKNVLSFGTCGSSPGQFLRPAGVAVDDEGNILTADVRNHHIQRFTSDGQFIAAVGEEGSELLQFSYPRGIAFNAGNGKVYVMDSGNSRCQVLNSNLTFFSSFGKEGNGRGQFAHPWGVACDGSGKVYVADTGNKRIQVFTAEGVFLKIFGRRGQGVGELSQPAGIAVDASGTVYVSDRFNHRVSLFTSEGQFVASFGKEGSGLGEFDFPVGLAVDTSGVLYVCDKENHRICLY